MSDIVGILMKRDGLTREEAQSQKEYAKELMLDALDRGDYDDVEELMYEELGLEMDYIDEMLF